MSQQCSSCRHWQEDPGQATVPRQGECKRNPPSVFPMPGGRLLSVHPPVPSTWPACGEFAAKPVELGRETVSNVLNGHELGGEG